MYVNKKNRSRQVMKNELKILLVLLIDNVSHGYAQKWYVKISQACNVTVSLSEIIPGSGKS